MKKTIVAIILVFIICTAFNKPNDTLESDYRDTYIGTYFCKCICNNSNGGTTSNLIMDTLSVSITKTAQDSVVQVNIGNRVLKLKLKNKLLMPYEDEGHFGGKFFSADSLDFYFAAGRSSSCRYLGKKES